METKSPHFWWIIILLSLAIISLVSFILSEKICNAERIMEFISYSTAILSITLSIFAIQYTYFSNIQIQQQFDKINAVAESIRATSERLNGTSSKLNDNLDNILEQLEHIDKSQQEMNTKLNMNEKVDNATNITNH